MPSYAAFLGHQPRISCAELRAVMPDLRIRRTCGSDIIVFDTAHAIDPAAIAHWGGTLLLATECVPAGREEDITPTLLGAVASVKGKVHFSLRTFGLPTVSVRRFYRTCKEALRQKGRSSRYFGNERSPAITALLHTHGIASGKHGAEIVILASDDGTLWIGRTIAAYNPTAYVTRDMKKPARDTRAGLLPPKLAQTLLNLGEWLVRGNPPPPHGSRLPPLTVLDPFCGSGVIPLECLLRGWPVLASDSAERAVDACKSNIQWCRKTFDVSSSRVPSGLSKHDARKPFDFSKLRDASLQRGPDLIVTESSLGPALRDRPTQKEAAHYRADAEDLQIAFLKNIHSCLPRVPIVTIWPLWFLRGSCVCLEKMFATIDKLGYDALLPPGIPPFNNRPTLSYRRPDQFVGREIVLLKPRKK